MGLSFVYTRFRPRQPVVVPIGTSAEAVVHGSIDIVSLHCTPSASTVSPEGLFSALIQSIVSVNAESER